MGSGIVLRCSCKEHRLNLGLGYGDVLISGLLQVEAEKGVYGEELKNLVVGKHNVYVDAERKFYYCSKCGYWETDRCLDLYQYPKGKLVPGGIGFENMKQINKYQHMCPECNIEMKNPKTIGKRVLNKIRCADCGGTLSIDEEKAYMWD